MISNIILSPTANPNEMRVIFVSDRPDGSRINLWNIAGQMFLSTTILNGLNNIILPFDSTKQHQVCIQEV